MRRKSALTLRATAAVLAAALAFFAGQSAFSQQTSDTRLYLVTYIDSFGDGAAKTGELLRQFAVDSRKDPGAVRFEILRDSGRRNHFTFIEVWQDRPSYEAHRKLEHTRQFRLAIGPLLASPFDERMYDRYE